MKFGLSTNSWKNSAAFTLVELLIVIAIIGVLAGLITVNLGGVRERGRDSQRKSDLHHLQTALRLYYNDYQVYPLSTAGNLIAHEDSEGDVTTFSWGDQFAVNSNTYMTQLPSDPLNVDDYVYAYWRSATDGDIYCAWAVLENDSDQQITETQSRCQTICGAEYVDLEDAYVVCNQ